MTNSDPNHEFKFTNNRGVFYRSLEDVIEDKVPNIMPTIESLKFSIKYY